MSEIGTYLRGTTLLITGATGFLAKAVVEKILRCAPDVGRIYLIVRSRRKKDGTTLSANERVVDEIFQSAAFARLREIYGDRFSTFMAEKVHAIEGDLTLDHLGLEPDVYQRLANEVNVVLTCAASVTFDEEIDAALRLNALGARRMLEFARTCNDSILVHISTAYVNGQSKGRIPEAPPRPDWSMAQEIGLSDTPFDLETETLDILTTADELHDESWSKARQAQFRSMALQQNARPKPNWLDAQMETFRKRWLKEQLIEEGMRRGQRWGWHDSYTLTKAMGEQLIVKHRGDLPTVIIRPSIVESGLVDPEPGWIEGLKVADPLIDALSKGRLPDFPGQKDMIVDIIPVDIVVNTILAAMARTTREDGISVYHVSTGDRNPVLFHQAFEFSYSYFQKHPRRDRNNEPIQIKPWTYPTLAQFRRRYNLRYIYPLSAVLWIFNHFNRFTLLNNWKRKITVLKSAISRMLYYASIYSPYTSLECIFETDRMAKLHESLDPEDRLLFNSDVSRIHWRNYFQDIHIPGLKRHVLKTDEPKPTTTEEEEVAERSGFVQEKEEVLPHKTALTDMSVEHPEKAFGKPPIAFFDVDGTIINATIVHYYAYYKTCGYSGFRRLLWTISFLPKILYYIVLDKISRSQFIQSFYQQYSGLKHRDCVSRSGQLFEAIMRPRIFSGAVDRIREHQLRGERVVLVTGSLDFIMEPLAKFTKADDLIALSMKEKDGWLTGETEGPLIGDEEKARIIIDYAKRHGIDLDRCYAYADSNSDQPMLRSVGYPVVVNPGRRLKKTAKACGWEIVHWTHV